MTSCQQYIQVKDTNAHLYLPRSLDLYINSGDIGIFHFYVAISDEAEMTSYMFSL